MIPSEGIQKAQHQNHDSSFALSYSFHIFHKKSQDETLEDAVIINHRIKSGSILEINQKSLDSCIVAM